MKTVSQILFFLGVLLTLTPSLHASIFDELDTERQQAVLTKLKDHMPNMINDDGLRKYARYMADNIPQFATNLGALSGGNYAPIVTQSLTLAGDQLAEYYKNSLADGLGQRGFMYLYNNANSFRNIGLAMMDEKNGWGDVGDVVWKEIKTSAMRDLNKWAEEGVKNTLNWIAGDRTLLGFGAADAYFMFIEAEIAIINAKVKKFNKKTTNELYAPYYLAREKNKNINHTLAFGTESNSDVALYGSDKNMEKGLFSAVTAKGFYAFRNMSEHEVSDLFERCYQKRNEYGDDLYRFVQDQAEQGITQAKKDLADVLHKPGMQFRNDINAFYDKVREKLNELVGEEIDTLTEQRDREIEQDEELKRQYEAALEKAGILLDQIEIADDKRRSACEGFTRQQQRKNEAVREKNKHEKAIAQLEKILDDLDKCPEISRESQGINNDITKLENLVKRSAQLFEQLQQNVTTVCDGAHIVNKSTDEDTARQALRNTITHGKSAERIATQARQTEEEVEKQAGALSSRISRFNKRFRGNKGNVAASLEENLTKAQELSESLAAWEAAEKQYRDAERRMESDCTKAVNLSLSIDKHYIEIVDILNDGASSKSVLSRVFSSDSNEFSGTFKWGSKAQALLTKARERQQHLADCNELIQLLVAQKREQLRGQYSLTHAVQNLFPDLLSSLTGQRKDDEESTDALTLTDVQAMKDRYNAARAKCASCKNVDSVAMLTQLSELQKKQIGTMQVRLSHEKMKLCVGAALSRFDEKFLDKEKPREDKETVDIQSQKQKAETYCKKRLPGSVPAFDKNGKVVVSPQASFTCRCPEGSIKYNNTCHRCDRLQQKFTNALRTKKRENAQEILEQAFHCDWVQNRENKYSLTEEEFCPDPNTVYLFDGDNEGQCVTCSQLETDFEDALKQNDTEYANTLISLAKRCDWSKNGAERIREHRCERELPGSVVVRSGGKDICRCPSGSVKLSDQRNNTMCVACSDLEHDFNAALKQGDRDYAETLLDLADGCSWTAGGKARLNRMDNCPSGTVKLSDDSGKNQCVPCAELEQDFDSTLRQGDFNYAETLLELSSSCGWVEAGGERLRNARKCPENTVKLSDESGQNHCVSCDTLYSDYTVAKGQGDHTYAASLLDLAAECSWTKQAAQQVRQEQLQAELNRKCGRQKPGSHAVIQGDRYRCDCNTGMVSFTDSKGNQFCKSCAQIRSMVNAALKRNDSNTVKRLIAGAQHCDWYDRAVSIVASLENNKTTVPRQSPPPPSKPGALTGTWDLVYKDLDPYYGKIGDSEIQLDFTGPAGHIVVTHTGDTFRGRLYGDEGQKIPVYGNINGNKVTLCWVIDERDCVSLTVNFNTMIMSGVKEGIRWTLKKRR